MFSRWLREMQGDLVSARCDRPSLSGPVHVKTRSSGSSERARAPGIEPGSDVQAENLLHRDAVEGA